MHHSKKKKSLIHRVSQPFFRSPSRQRDLPRLQQAYHYLTSSTAYDKTNKHLRGLELAQQLVDPNIKNIQTVLDVLKHKMTLLQSDAPIETTSMLTTEDSCNQYPCDYTTDDQYAAWMHYVNCLLRFSEEESLIDSEVYHYAGARTTTPDTDTDDEDRTENTLEPRPRLLPDPQTAEEESSPEGTRSEPPHSESTRTETSEEENSEKTSTKKRGSFLSRFFRWNRNKKSE